MLSVASLFVSHQAQASGGRLIEDGKNIGTVTREHMNVSAEPDNDSFLGRRHGVPENK